MPNHLCAAGLGRVFGHRLLCLSHVGRRSGRIHHTVLEVARYDKAAGEATVVAAYGPSAPRVQNWRGAARGRFGEWRGQSSGPPAT